MTMAPQELAICREIHAALTSRDRENINYLFLEPVDPTFFPTYHSTVERPMDLRTLWENLEDGTYARKDEFYADARLIFDNAVLFHGDRAESGFVADFARRMSKAFDRARKKAEKKAARLAGGGARGDEKVVKGSEKKRASGGGDQRVSGEGEKKKKKISIKLKRQKSISSLAESSSTDSSVGVGGKGEFVSTSDLKPAKKSKTKLKLKLSMRSDDKKVSAPKPKVKLSVSSSKPATPPSKPVTSPSKPAAPSSKPAAPHSKLIAPPSKQELPHKSNSAASTKLSSPPSKPTLLRKPNSVASSKSAAPSSKLAAPHKLHSAAGKFEHIPMNSVRGAQCYKILSSLKRRQPSEFNLFHKPVTDPAIRKDYKAKIANPVDLSTISSKLDKDLYRTIDEFVLDLRRIASNCLQYNTSVNDAYRPIAKDFLTAAEELCKFFIAKNEAPKLVYPSLLYCWENCVKALDELINMTNPDDGHQTAWYFLQPVSYFCGGSFPDGYTDKVKNPIDLGTIVQLLITGRYLSVGAFVADCQRVVENCNAFYAGDEEGASMCEKANRLNKSMEINLCQLSLFDQSEKGLKAKEKASLKCMVIKRPEKDFLRDIMRELRATTYTDRGAKITEKATLHFENPVDTTIFTDYLEFVETPMDLQMVDHKIESGSYVTPEDFEFDIVQIFMNCLRYNGRKKNLHLVNLGKHTMKIFRRLFAEKMRVKGDVQRFSLPTLANRASVVTNGGKVGGKKRPTSPFPEERPSKKASMNGSLKGFLKGSRKSSKSLPSPSSKRSATKLNAGTKPVAKSRSKVTPLVDPSVPIPMHVAIATIKESYPGRRQNKDLQGWEADCLKVLRQLMRHAWVSAERPKYIFHVPVHILFPEIREIYAQKIKRPMDLTTVEAKLLQGVYQNAEEFISDTTLVFSNAIAFNKDGYDMGEPMSCAYYEASSHLLKYLRWLSLEVLQSCLTDCSDSPIVDSGSASNWKLTVRNRELARKEMESIAFSELVDKTVPGEKYSWSEQEIEKLLKSLRHMSDAKHMMYFVQMSFPADYTAFISKPIAWDKCNEKLRGRKFNTIGEAVVELRLIFSNALKYNEGARHVNKVSGQAYKSAIHMSAKLEAAIDKMLVTVSDRIGRERIDMISYQRDLEAKERAEEEQRKRQWEKEHPRSTVEVKTKLRIVNQRQTHRKKMTDFEFPFYDEEDDQIESHSDSLQHVKALYEKQREARASMQEISLSIGMSVFRKLQERAAAKAWVYQMTLKANNERVRIEREKADAEKENPGEVCAKPSGAYVSSTLNDNNRKQIKMKIQKRKKSKRDMAKLTSL